MSTYEKSLFELVNDDTRRLIEQELIVVPPQRVPHISEMFLPPVTGCDAFGEDIVLGDEVVYSGTLWDDSLTINKGVVEDFRDIRVLVHRKMRSSRHGIDMTPRRVWVDERKVSKLKREEYED